MTPKRLRAHWYAVFNREGERVDTVAFYDTGQNQANLAAVNWAKGHRYKVMRIKKRSTGA